jgi:hypothetical protein
MAKPAAVWVMLTHRPGQLLGFPAGHCKLYGFRSIGRCFASAEFLGRAASIACELFRIFSRIAPFLGYSVTNVVIAG